MQRTTRARQPFCTSCQMKKNKMAEPLQRAHHASGERILLFHFNLKTKIALGLRRTTLFLFDYHFLGLGPFLFRKQKQTNTHTLLFCKDISRVRYCWANLGKRPHTHAYIHTHTSSASDRAWKILTFYFFCKEPNEINIIRSNAMILNKVRKHQKQRNCFSYK